MSFSPVPDYKFKALTDISTGFLTKNRISLLLLDLDNTIAPYGETSPTAEVLAWVIRIKSFGISLHIVSNSKKTERVSSFAKALEIPYIYRAKKPSPRAVRELISELQASPSSAALVGDQIYTDVLAANGACVMSIVVRPIKFTNPFLALRFSLELPFRALRRIRRMK